MGQITGVPRLTSQVVTSASDAPNTTRQFPFIIPSTLLAPSLTRSFRSTARLRIPGTIRTLLAQTTGPLPNTASILCLASSTNRNGAALVDHTTELRTRQFGRGDTDSLVIPIPLDNHTFLAFSSTIVTTLMGGLEFGCLCFSTFMRLIHLNIIMPTFSNCRRVLIRKSEKRTISTLNGLIRGLRSTKAVIVTTQGTFFRCLDFGARTELLSTVNSESTSFSELTLQQ